jgi:nitrogen fixation protein NifU and related proteins
MNAETVSTFDNISVDQMYREHILDHYKNPRNYGIIEADDIQTIHDHNPLCGDKITLQLRIKNNIIIETNFTGDGCAISKASSSLFTEYIKEKNVKEITRMQREDMQQLIGITPASARIKCMMLCLTACKKIITNGHKIHAKNNKKQTGGAE